jgi:hypothetical protein
MMLDNVAIVCCNSYMEHHKKDKPTGINTRYPQDVISEMRRLAEAHGRSFNGEVIWALRYYLASQKGETPHDKKSL